MFIVFEGVDRVGKTTAIEETAKMLREQNHEVITISESSDPVVQYIKQSNLPIEEIVPMMFDIRSEHQLLIERFINSKTILLWDRYYDSTYVYGYNYGLTHPDWETELFNYYTPDLTIYLYAEIDVILSRIDDEKDRFTNGSYSDVEKYLGRYKELYDKVAKQRPIFPLDVTHLDEYEVANMCRARISGLF